MPLSKQLIRKLSIGKNDFVFDKELDNAISGMSTLDGFFEDEARLVFVTSKCDEPYSIKINNSNPSYAALYEYLNESMLGELSMNVL